MPPPLPPTCISGDHEISSAHERERERKNSPTSEISLYSQRQSSSIRPSIPLPGLSRQAINLGLGPARVSPPPPTQLLMINLGPVVAPLAAATDAGVIGCTSGRQIRVHAFNRAADEGRPPAPPPFGHSLKCRDREQVTHWPTYSCGRYSRSSSRVAKMRDDAISPQSFLSFSLSLALQWAHLFRPAGAGSTGSGPPKGASCATVG